MRFILMFGATWLLFVFVPYLLFFRNASGGDRAPEVREDPLAGLETQTLLALCFQLARRDDAPVSQRRFHSPELEARPNADVERLIKSEVAKRSSAQAS